MKLVTYTSKAGGNAERLGILTADESQIVDLLSVEAEAGEEASGFFTDMIAFVSGGEPARKRAAELLKVAGKSARTPASEARLLAPLRPRVMRDTMCFEGHIINCYKTRLRMLGQDPEKADPSEYMPSENWYKTPVYYKVNVNSIIGTDVDVTFPEGERFKDFELELAIVIGKEGKNINARDAMGHVGGYTIFNDFSARTTQAVDMGDPRTNVGPGVSKDFANGLGPCLVTPDAFDWRDAKATVRVNGKERYTGNHGEIHYTVPDIIEHASNNITLYPGDIICTGTITNCSGFEHGQPLLVDDVIELEIEGIGVLRNKIVAPKATKVRNKDQLYKRSVCAPGAKGSSFAIRDDYPDVWRSMQQTADVWRIDEMPAGPSATLARDMGNLPIEHEAPKGGSTLRHVGMDFTLMPSLSEMPEAMRGQVLDYINETHRVLGTHYIPTREDMKKHPTMHKTDSLNLFFCSQSGGYISLNDQLDVHLEPGDALIQAACMHGWRGKGVISGLLVSADMSTLTQLTRKPKPAQVSSHRKFKRYVAATMKSDTKEIGESDVIIEDYAPNTDELRDEAGDLLGYAGDIWKTFAPNADVSCQEDPVSGPMEPMPPKGGITFRMVELFPGKKLTSQMKVVNYYCVVTGELTARSDTDSTTAGAMQDIIQLRGAALSLENTGNEPVLMAHFLIDAEGAQ